MNKRASMELGISTVVVLVIAMVLIAGGIAFIRGFFKLGTDKLGGAFNVGDFGVQPTSVDPLVLVEGAPNIKAGQTAKVRVGFYNRGDVDAVDAKIQFSDCVSTKLNTGCDTGAENAVPLIQSLKQTVKVGDAAGFETYITAKCNTGGGTSTKDLVAGDYICTIIATDGYGNPNFETKQITLTVTQ